jgi:signal transduction histidine kinase
MGARQTEALTRAFSGIQKDFRQEQAQLLEIGQSLANDAVIRRDLAGRDPAQPPSESLVRNLTRLELPERISVEVYDPTPRLVAWNGFSMPLDDAPGRQRFLEGVATATVEDGDQRTALVVWVPVRDGLRVVGAVRVMRLLEIAVPVENQYLRSFSQARIWSERTRLPVRFRYDIPFDDELPSGGEVRLLSGIDGTRLGRVFIETPSEEDVIDLVSERYNDILSFWATLIMLWAVILVWWWYRQASPSRGSGVRIFRLGVFSAGLCLTRFVLGFLDVPARFQSGKAPLAPLFDPTHLASGAGAGLLRSTGDVVVTAAFAIVLAAAWVAHAGTVETRGAGDSARLARSAVTWLKSFRAWFRGLLLLVVAVFVSGLLAAVSQAIVLDSTLEYFARTGLLPEPLVLVVFFALIVLTAAFLLFAAAAFGRIVGLSSGVGGSADMGRTVAAVIAALLLLIVLWVPGWLERVALPLGVLLFGAAALATSFAARTVSHVQRLALRTVLPAILLLTVVLYPFFYNGMQSQRQMRMIDAAATFEDWRDPRVQYAIEQLLVEARDNPRWLELLALPDTSATRRLQLDSLITDAVRNSFLASLGSYELSLTAYSADGLPVGRYYEVEPRLGLEALISLERLDLDLLQGMHEESGEPDFLVEPLTDPSGSDRFPYYGLAPVETVAGRVVGWLVVRAEPRALLREAITPFPRALVPAGFYGNLPGRLSVAVFRDGALVRSTGDDIASYRLPETVSEKLGVRNELWQSERVRGESFYTYYQLRQSPDVVTGVPVATVIAVRVSAINAFDHLYNLLRLTFGGLLVGLPVYLIGLIIRKRRGLLPAPRVRFRDKILNAFLGVGIVTVALMGVVGLGVVTSENEREIEERLRQHLERVERSLALEARGGEMTYRVLDRLRIDSLSARVGLDINVFKDNVLVASSRPQFVRDRLIDPRLPISAYEALYIDGFKFCQTEEHLGSFSYTAGFRAIPDEEGRAHFVISIPTLPEQDQIEEERARTVAYLFGALLLLVFVVLITASLLANALTRPIARLRDGIEAVAHGRFNRIRPLDTRDEISELVDSFNTMQDQLGESRRRLARQERQLAWREMARQVAHEIKNPLTPMKLSVQHLRRSFARSDDTRGDGFAGLFERITTTLTEQIDALARIANEFSSFARMPRRVEEPLDINSVVEEAAALMQAEASFELDLNLVEEPLIVHADREEVRRIFINLIKNAIQSIPDDRDGEIGITTRSEGSGRKRWAHVTVSDNGAGIPEDVRSKIFVPNFSTKTSGTGLGLAIVRQSVEDLLGEIDFVTSEEEGTSFWIRLPLTVEPYGEVEALDGPSVH